MQHVLENYTTFEGRGGNLGDHLKTGHLLSVQNRPLRVDSDVICFTLPQ